MQAYLNRLTDAKAMKFIDQVGDIFKSLPLAPKGLIDFLVKIVPYLALLGAILSIITGPIVGLLGTLASLALISPVVLVVTLVTTVLMLVQAVLLFVAYKPLKDLEKKGWVYLFWAEVVSVIQSIVALLDSRGGSIVFAIVFTALWFYILFQMRPRYTK